MYLHGFRCFPNIRQKLTVAKNINSRLVVKQNPGFGEPAIVADLEHSFVGCVQELEVDFRVVEVSVGDPCIEQGGAGDHSFRDGFIVIASATLVGAFGCVVSLFLAPVAGDVCFPSSRNFPALFIDVGEGNVISGALLPATSALLLPVGQQVVRFGDCLWILILSLEEVIFEVLEQTAVSVAVTAQ